MKRKPQFFLLGAPKCGTTALASYLEDHPRILVSIPKEPNYFCKDLKAGGIPTQSDDEYVGRFFPSLHQSGCLAAIDCSVWYLYSEVAVDEIMSFQPDAKFLIMLRNPVEMAWSLHSMFTFQNQEDMNDFLLAWSLQEVRRDGSCLPEGLWLDKRMLLYRDVCALGTQLNRVVMKVGWERIHVELLDDLQEDPRGMYLRVLQFMHVYDDGREEFPRENSGRKVGSEFLFKMLRNSIVKGLAEVARNTMKIETLGFGRPDLRMPPKVRKFLVQEFKNEIRWLEELLARDLGCWRSDRGGN